MVHQLSARGHFSLCIQSIQDMSAHRRVRFNAYSFTYQVHETSHTKLVKLSFDVYFDSHFPVSNASLLRWFKRYVSSIFRRRKTTGAVDFPAELNSTRELNCICHSKVNWTRVWVANRPDQRREKIRNFLCYISCTYKNTKCNDLSNVQVLLILKPSFFQLHPPVVFLLRNSKYTT